MLLCKYLWSVRPETDCVWCFHRSILLLNATFRNKNTEYSPSATTLIIVAIFSDYGYIFKIFYNNTADSQSEWHTSTSG
jgi:hypothetical protein